MTDEFRPCVLIPTYDNPATLRGTVERCRAHLDDVLVVDDGSGPEGRAVCDAIAEEGLAQVVHREANGGKGAAVKTGFREAKQRGYTHALQVDADGQHDLDAIPRYLEVAEQNPDALVLSDPEFGESGVPKGRQLARSITTFWVNIETGGRVIHDPMCGFRVYPVEPANQVEVAGDKMDFDPEVAVRLVWHGVPVINLPLQVYYPTAEEGGVSHYRLFRDNFLMGLLHTRLCVEKVFGLMRGKKYGRQVRLLEPGR